MEKKDNLFNTYIFAFTIIIWTLLNVSGIQNLYFDIDRTSSMMLIATVKIFHLFFLYFIFAKIHSLYAQRHTEKGKTEIIISVIYFAILMIFLLLTWPGTWSWDDVGILYEAESYGLTPWHHFFSGLFQIMCLQTIPIASGVIIIQIIITSLILGYCISNISTLYGKNKKQVRILQIILGIIPLFPPLIIYILSGFRMGIYSYLELLLITKLIILFKEQKKVTLKEILKISFLTIVISCWRTEALYYPFCLMILFIILGKKVISRKCAIITIMAILIINSRIGKINNSMIGNNNYTITATMEPVTTIVKLRDESDKEEIEIINKVLSVQYILDNPDLTGENYYWAGVVKKYTKEEYSDYLKAYLKLALKHPKTTFNSMWNIFEKAGSGQGENSKQTTRNVLNGSGNTLRLYEKWSGSSPWRNLDSKLKQPINLNIRNKVISFLCGIDLNYDLTIIHNIFWNLFIPFTLILLSFIYKLIKKDWFMVFLILTIIARIIIVFVTAPSPYFMYYLSAYLCSYIIFTIVIFEFIINLKNKKIRGYLCEKNY